MGHNRKLVFGGTSLTRASLDHSIVQAVTGTRDELEQLMIDSGYLDGAPFRWVSLIFRFGREDEDKPHYQRIHPTHRDLPLAIEVDIRRIKGADAEVQRACFKIAALKSLIHAGIKYELDIGALEDELDRLQAGEDE